MIYTGNALQDTVFCLFVWCGKDMYQFYGEVVFFPTGNETYLFFIDDWYVRNAIRIAIKQNFHAEYHKSHSQRK